MGSKTNNGFTIIEAMLFLAVTGLLASVILLGSGATINQQRYRDSLNSLKSYFQDQYNQTANTINGRQGVENCSSASVQTSGVAQPRGTSECLLVGKLVTIDSTGTKVTSANVLGYRTVGAPEESNTIDEIKNNYTLGVSSIEQDVTEVAWGARVVSDTAPYAAKAASILILRSPVSGSIMTYTVDGVQPSSQVKDMVELANSNKPRLLCLDPSAQLMGSRAAVRIGAYAGSQGAVEIPPESERICG